MVKSALLLVAVGAGTAAGCVDARGSFDQFADRVGFTDASTADRAGGDLHDITGTFLYSTRAAFETTNNPDYYIQFIMRSTMVINGDTATLNGVLTPLCTYDTCTERNEVPPALSATEAIVAMDGTFASNFGGTLPGPANPFSGTNQPLDTMTMGTIMSPDFFCGDVAGTAAGLNLQGSSFAAQRITDVTPANLPAPISACPPVGGVDAGVIDAPAVDAPTDAPADAPTDADDDATPQA